MTGPSLTEFRAYAHQVADMIADYLEGLEDRPVRAQVAPGSILAQLPTAPPMQGESLEAILRDVETIVLPGLTHWQHPRFFSYFTSTGAPASLLAEMLTAAFAQQAMLWETSPAANEIEARMLEWLRGMTGLPESFTGSIQDSGSTANLVALLVARESALGWRGDAEGLAGCPPLVVYTSEEAHSSIAKAARIAGYGQAGTRLIPSDDAFAMRVDALEAAIAEDRAAGRLPACLVGCFGATGVGAMDPLEALSAVAEREGLYFHVDAAWAGNALLLEEVRPLAAGIERADSVVFNPNKWLGTNFDVSAHYVKDPRAVLQTLSILPAYLRSETSSLGPEYRDWTVPLGRRFRALKVWFVLRAAGVEGLQAMIRMQIDAVAEVERQARTRADVEILAPRRLSLLVLRFCPQGIASGERDAFNKALMARVNDAGFAYITGTQVRGAQALRFVAGGAYTEARHVQEGWDHLCREAEALAREWTTKAR